MSQPTRIGVFYSKGRSYLEVLRCVHRHEPEARICAIVPAGYLPSNDERAAADEVVETRATDRIETRADAGHHSVLHEAPPFAQFAQHAWECQTRLPYVVRADPQPDGHLAGPQRGT